MAVNIPPHAPQHVYAAAAEQALAWGRPDGALEVCELGLARHPSYAGLRVFRAEALLSRERVPEAEADLRAVLAAEPQHPRALKLISGVLMGQQRYREALRFLESAEFLLYGDQQVADWLQEADAHRNDEPPPPPAPTPLHSPAIQELTRELTSLSGVVAVQLQRGSSRRLMGNESSPEAKALARIAALETDVTSVLDEAAFGELTDVTLQTAGSVFTSHITSHGTVRVAAAPVLREGLIAWHVAKVFEKEGS